LTRPIFVSDSRIPLLQSFVFGVVIDSDPRPPPIIYHGPQNQTLPTDGSAVLPCLARGEPSPNIIWLKGRSPLNTHDRRVNVLESGSLEISSTPRHCTALVFAYLINSILGLVLVYKVNNFHISVHNSVRRPLSVDPVLISRKLSTIDP